MIVTEEIQLKDGVSGPAKTAAKSVTTLRNEMNVLKDSLKATTDAMVKAQARGDTKTFEKLSQQAGQYKAALGGVNAQMSQTNGGLGDIQAQLAEVTGGLSVVVEAVGAAVAGFGALVLAGAAFTLEAVEMKEKMISLFDALGEGKISGKETLDMLDELGDKFGQTREKLAPLAQGFLTLGITGKAQLESLTLAAASAGTIAVDGGAAFTKFFGQINAAAETGSKLTVPFKKLETQLKATGLNIGDLAKKMNTTEAALTKGLKAGTVDAKAFGDALTSAATDKGADALLKQGMALTNVWAKFKENMSKLFEDVDVSGFLTEVKSLFDIFGQGTNSGKALKAGIGGFFKEVFAVATKLVPMVKHFFLDLIILGLKAYITIKPIVAYLKQMWQQHDGMGKLKAVFELMLPAIKVLGVVIGVVIAALVGFVAILVGVQVAAVAAAAIVMGFATKALAAVGEWAAGAVTAAKDFITGLVKGITSGATAVVDAVKNVANGAKNAFKNALGISSPSKVMMQMGNFTAQGVAEGMSAGAPDVHAASKDLAGAAAGGMASAGGGAAAGGGKGGVTVNVEQGAIQINGAGKSAEGITEAMISLMFERIALSQGLG